MLSRRRPVPDERGTALLLVPAGVLILLVLGAICVDTAAVFLGERELANAAAAAANDAAAAAVDRATFYDTGGASPVPDGEVVLDQGLAVQAANRSIDAKQLDGVALIGVRQVDVTGDTVTVELEGTVMPIFARAVLDTDGWAVGASASATARRG